MREGHEQNKREFEDYAYVLDFLEYGYPDDTRPLHQKKPVAQAFGEKQFVMMELTFKDNQVADLAEKLYIGKGKREKVEFVSKMLKYDQLTPTAKTELLHVIKEAVKAQEERFVEFLNNCGPITNRMHTLQLLPGIGKTSMWKVIEEREIKKFESFKDFEDRVRKNIVDPLSKRIEEELKEPQKHYVFVKWKTSH